MPAASNATSGWWLALVAWLCTAVLGTAAVAQQDPAADWTGTWETRWRDGGATLILQQDGATITGTYPLYEGRIEATAVGRELRGRWIEPGRTGTFVFVQSRDGQSFAGRFGSGEWWTGARGASDDVPGSDVDQSSPMGVMRTFMTAANAAQDGDLEAMGAAVAVIRQPEGQEAAGDRFQLARALFSVIDQTTFRLWNLPHAENGDDDLARAVLQQSGTGLDVPVTFRRIDGLWYLEAPSAERLEGLHDRLRAARAAASEGSDGGMQSGSPRETMRSFLLSFRFSPDGTAPEALAALDLRGRPEVTRLHEGQVLAGYLKRVIDRTGYVIWQEIPDDPASRLPYVHFEHPEGRIVIAPVETEDGVVWQFSPETLRKIRRVYAAMEDMPVAEGIVDLADSDVHFAIRGALRSIAPAALGTLGPFERWQWGALAATLLLMLGAAQLAGRTSVALARGNLPSSAEGQPAGASWAARGLAAGLVLFAANWLLGLPESVSLVLATVATLLVVVGLFLLGWRGVGLVGDRYRRGDRVTGHNLILLSLTTGVLRGALLIVAILAVAHALSLPITGVLAGFGIGGIAVALAAQPTLQNLLAGFTLYADRPISVGDFCRFGDKMGTVEHIGLRSTRLRTLDRTVVSVPNSQFLDMELENFARRDRFLFTTTLQLRYETTPDQMRYVLVALRKLLIAHPKVLADPLRVRFAGLGSHSLDVDVFSYILAADIGEFTAIREDVLLRIVETVEDAGAQFAFPSVVHYHAEDKASDARQIDRVESVVADWRGKHELPFPDFDWQSKAELSGSLDYPPDGSVLKTPGGHGPEQR